MRFFRCDPVSRLFCFPARDTRTPLLPASASRLTSGPGLPVHTDSSPSYRSPGDNTSLRLCALSYPTFDHSAGQTYDYPHRVLSFFIRTTSCLSPWCRPFLRALLRFLFTKRPANNFCRSAYGEVEDDIPSEHVSRLELRVISLRQPRVSVVRLAPLPSHVSLLDWSGL